MKDENKTHELNKKFQEETIRKEKETMQQKMKTAEARNTKLTKDNQDLKVTGIEKDEQIKKYIGIEDALNKKIQRKETEIERERVENQKLKAELNSIQAENRNIGGMDGRDVRDMVEKNKELEE